MQAVCSWRHFIAFVGGAGFLNVIVELMAALEGHAPGADGHLAFGYEFPQRVDRAFDSVAVQSQVFGKRKINPTPALRQNLCASGVGIPLPLTDQENLGYDLIRKGWENGSQRLTRRAVEISRARSTGQIRESGYVERKGDRDVP